MQRQLFFAVQRGHIAEKNYLGNRFEFVADIDTEKYNQIISAMNLDKR